jgi:hypothetical protein
MGMAYPPDPPVGGLWGRLLQMGRGAAGVARQAFNPTTPGWSERGVPGLVRGVVEGLQRNPIGTVVDFSPLGDAKALAYDAPREFLQGNTGMGLLALASAIPGIPGLGKLVGDAGGVVRSADLPMDEASRMARAREMGFDVDTPLYHGTARPDRIGEVFDPARATSGPNAFFTDSPEVASNYATQKLDTSRINEGRSFSDMFKFALDDGTEVPLDNAFRRLPVKERVALRRNLGRVTEDYDAEDFALVMGEGPGGAQHWEHALREQGGDPLKAAEDLWLNSAILHGDEGRFVDVLREAGLPPSRVRYDDPFAQYPGVVPARLKMGNVLDVHHDTDAVRQLAERLKAAPDVRNAEIDADMWGKDRRSTHEWADALLSDVEQGNNSYAWTSIPDAVSDELRAMGYDTIKDMGGKGGGMGHTVYVPLGRNQIRSPFARFDPSQAESSNIMAGLMGLLGTGALLRANNGRER